MAKLTDTQLVILSAASQRDDGLVIMPEKLKGGAAKAVAMKLMSLGFAKETAVKRDEPSWRVNDEGRPVGLKITAAGLAAIGVSAEGPSSKKSDKAARTPRAAVPAEEPSKEPPGGSKQALVVSLLQRAKGAKLQDLIAATGWLPHTTRAALTGLRKKGYNIEKSRAEDGTTIYKIAADSERATKQLRASARRPKAA